MKLTGKNQKYFWRLLDKLDGSPHDSLFKDGISAKRWIEHFKTVLRDENREISYPADSAELGPLDYRITRSELNEASYVLRPDKSTGQPVKRNDKMPCRIKSWNSLETS